MARPIRFLLVVALGVAALLLVALLAGYLYFDRAPRTERPRHEQRAAAKTAAPERKPIVIPPPVAPPYEPESEDSAFDGPTRFVRRLQVGTQLQAMAQRSASSGAIQSGFLALLPYCLAADGQPPEDYRSGIRFLTKPRRDRDALYLHDGPAGRLRVWTLKPEMDFATVQRAGDLLTQLIAVAGHRMPQGLDILCTPKMGRDVFPKQPHIAGAAGIYHRTDRYCAVRSTMEKRHVSKTMRHELVHAYTLGPARLRSAPRFISEGIAEYLRHLGPRDGGFQIPPHAMRDELAYLVTAFEFMERMGIDLSGIRVSWLVNLKPWQFYRLPFGYPTALAMHAYVGGAPIEEAARSRSPEPLIKALSRVKWSDFREWLQREANGGEAANAWFTNDGAAPVPDDATGGESGWDLLRAIGAVTKGSNRKKSKEAFDAMRAPEQVDAVVKMLLERDTESVILATDLSTAMDRAMKSVATPMPLRSRELPVKTPRDVVAAVLHTLEHSGNAMPKLVGITAQLTPAEGVATVAPYTPDRLADWLAKHAEPRMGLIVCSAQPPSGRSTVRMMELCDAIPSNAVVLVIDLCPRGMGDASVVARKLARRGPGMRIAYWHP